MRLPSGGRNLATTDWDPLNDRDGSDLPGLVEDALFQSQPTGGAWKEQASYSLYIPSLKQM